LEGIKAAAQEEELILQPFFGRACSQLSTLSYFGYISSLP